MSQPKILVLGSSGFVGHNIHKVLSASFPTIGSSRKEPLAVANDIYFDLEDERTWTNIVNARPDIVINATGYGVVKYQKDWEKLKIINYYQPYRLKNYLDKQLGSFFWIQIGTAFEYDLSLGGLYEDSSTMPLTDYGISKLLFSQFLNDSGKTNFLILRPFAMFGPHEDASKIIPALILAQKERKQLSLTSGMQQRDYFFVKDIAHFIKCLINRGVYAFGQEVINIGAGSPVAIKTLATKMSLFIPGFDPAYWEWGHIEQRINEGGMFFNASAKSKQFGFTETATDVAFMETINYYYQDTA